MNTTIKQQATILFAGDSGDGIQLTGGQFTNTTAQYGNDLSTFPNFPAEIRAPQGTLAGVSGFQIKFGSIDVFTPGDQCDVLVVMNGAALKTNLGMLRNGGIIVANIAGFDKKNLRLAHIEENPLEDGSLDNYDVKAIDITKLTRAVLKESGLGQKEIDRSKNMFALGYIYWMFDRPIATTEKYFKEKFANKPVVRDANISVLKAGYNFGETSETNQGQYSIKPAALPKGNYRNIMGNQAVALGLLAASKKAKLDLFYGSYPITPASTLLHELAEYKNFGVKTFQAEDEIAAVCAAIGASFGGALAITGSSGPGVALKGEAIGLALILELPLVICNVQRGGPSTGLPTKTEQADLFQAMYGRNGEAPMPVLAASTPADCFYMAFEACRIALEHMTPVILLTDGYIANGSEPWRYPKGADLPSIEPPLITKEKEDDQTYFPYRRNEMLIRKWAIPGTKGYEHRIGGLEKEDETGNVSYDPENHERMIKIRAEKVHKVAQNIPLQELDNGKPNDDLLIIGWGSTFGSIKTAVRDLNAEGLKIAHAHIKYLNPFPSNLGMMIREFDQVLIVEMNDGQLLKILKAEFLVDAIGLQKIQGIPITVQEIKDKVSSILS